MTNIVKDPLIPTDVGVLTPQEALAQAGEIRAGNLLYDAALTRLLLVLTSRAASAGETLEAHLQRFQGRFSLYGGEAPFLQIPEEEALRLGLLPQSLNMLRLAASTGSDVTLLSGDRDSHWPQMSSTEALCALVTWQLFAPVRGKTATGYHKDSPFARTLLFTAHGETLGETAALCQSTLEPLWYERPSDFSQWGCGHSVPLDRERAALYPWWAVHIEGAGDAAYSVRLGHGQKPEGEEGAPVADPQTYRYWDPQREEERSGKNPQSRSAYPLLCRVLADTLSERKDVSVPLGFQRARDMGGCQRVSAAGLSTRSGKSVIFAEVYAELPWPTIKAEVAASVLYGVLEGFTELMASLSGRYAKDDPQQKKPSEREEYLYVRGAAPAFWERIRPALNARLLGLEAGDLEGAIAEASAAARAELRHG